MLLTQVLLMLDAGNAVLHNMFCGTHTQERYAAMQAKAKEVGAPLTLVPDLEQYEGGAGLRLGLAGAHQRINAALAVALAAAWEARHVQVRPLHAVGH